MKSREGKGREGKRSEGKGRMMRKEKKVRKLLMLKHYHQKARIYFEKQFLGLLTLSVSLFARNKHLLG